jgi:predicted nucleic acid-binding protein
LTGYLLDTSVLSAFAPDRSAIAAPLRRWMSEQGGRGTLFTSAIVVEEIQKGLARLKRLDATARAARLEKWLDGMLDQFGDRVLPVDSAVARRAGEIEDAAIAKGRGPGLADVLIAATAVNHGLSVATANIRHFAALGVPHFDPTALPTD